MIFNSETVVRHHAAAFIIEILHFIRDKKEKEAQDKEKNSNSKDNPKH